MTIIIRIKGLSIDQENELYEILTKIVKMTCRALSHSIERYTI